MTKAWVRATGTQISPNGAKTVELATEAEIFKNIDDCYIVYKNDSDMTTTLKIQKDRVDIFNNGRYNSRMVFEKDKKHITPYMTESGVSDLGIIGKNMHMDLRTTGGELDMSYHLLLDDKYIGTNELKMIVREVN